MRRLDVTLLGRFEARVDGEPVPPGAWRYGRALELVKLLALAPAHRLPRDRVLDALWPRLGAGAALANLHKTAHHGRRALGDPGGLVLRGGLVLLAPEAEVTTDVEAFEAAADPALYGGDLLPDDLYAPWSEEPRRALRERYLQALRAAGRWEELAAADPADEAAQLAVMRARFAAGDRPGAVEAFDRLVAALGELGLEPGPETFALHARVAGGAAYERALAAVELELARAPLAERGALLATRADLLLGIADRGAPAAYGEAAAAAGPQGLPLRIRQSWAQLATGDPNGARATLAQLAPESESDRIAHRVALAAAAWYAGDPAEAGRIAAEAEDLALEAGAEREARTALQIRVMVAHSTGDWPGAVRHGLDRSLLTPDLADVIFDGHLCVAQFVLASGQPLDGIAAVGTELHANAVRSGARRAQAFAATLLGEVALIAASTDEADARLREAVHLSREIGAVSAEALASLRLAEAAHARGAGDESESLLADALVISRWSPMNSHLLPLGYAVLLRATDDPELGLARLDDAGAYLREHAFVCAYCGIAFHVAAAIAATRGGEREQAARHLAEAETTSAMWPGGPWPAALDEARAELALAGGDAAGALALLHAAGAAFARDGRLLDAGRVHARLAALA